MQSSLLTMCPWETANRCYEGLVLKKTLPGRFCWGPGTGHESFLVTLFSLTKSTHIRISLQGFSMYTAGAHHGLVLGYLIPSWAFS